MSKTTYDHYEVNHIKLSAILRNPKISRSAKALLCDLLISYARTNNSAFPKEETLAEDMGLSTRHIRNLLTELITEKLLTFKRRGFNQSNIYSFNEELYFLKDNLQNKLTSYDSGNPIPYQSGSSLPDKVFNQSIQIKNYTNLIKLYESVNHHKIEAYELSQLKELASSFNEEFVISAVKELKSRKKFTTIKPALIQKVICDWQQDGKTRPKPYFIPCNQNGCEGGLILNSAQQNCSECKCKTNFYLDLQKWKENL